MCYIYIKINACCQTLIFGPYIMAIKAKPLKFKFANITLILAHNIRKTQIKKSIHDGHLQYFLYISIKLYIVASQKNRLFEAFLMGSHSI